MQGKKKILAFVLLAVLSFSFLGASVMGDSSLNPDMPKESKAAARGGSYTLLLLGKDRAAELCDVLMLASFDLDLGTLHILQIPRDTYFSYTEDDYKKINAAPRVLGGADKLCSKLSDALGISIDGYVEFDLDFVKDAVDRIGGVEINVPCDMDYDDPAQNLSIHLKKGERTLSGDEAVQFVRFRSGYRRADLSRMDAQKLFLAAFAKSFSKKVSAAELPSVLWLAAKHLKTDMRLDTMISLAVGMRKMQGESITVLTLPGEEVQSEYSGAWYYILSREGASEAVEKYLAGQGGTFSGFDPELLFTDTARKNFNEIYEKKIFAVPYTFEGLGSEGISIE